jgi:ankyrin repeat protein
MNEDEEEEEERSFASMVAQMVYQNIILLQKPLSGASRAFIEAHPESIQTPVYGALVIHHACIHVPSLELIQFLVEVFPESLITPWDISGRLPIHCALAHPNTSQEIVEFLAKMCPESLMTPNSSGRLPFHEACLNGCSLSILKFLLEKSPDSIKATGMDGCLPIHHALTGAFGGMITAMHVAPVEVIEYLIDNYPESVEASNVNGDLPLHLLAKTRFCSFEHFTCMVQASPFTVLTANRKGQMAYQIYTESWQNGRDDPTSERVIPLLRTIEQELAKFVAKARMDLGKVAFRLGDNGEVMQHAWDFLVPKFTCIRYKGKVNQG